MVSEHRHDEEAEEPGGSVFGNLPRERPGTRSPRREARTAARSGADRGASRKPGGTEGTAEDAAGRGMEDVAWAGIAIAAEAATLGVRLANRAIDAIRGPAERS